MKKTRNILILLLVICVTACLFTGCESEAEKIEKLAGTWYITIDDTEKEAEGLLAAQDLYEEEIALVDLTALKYAQTVEFNTDKTYSFAFDPEGTKDCVRAFVEKAFEDMYEGRTVLDAVYEQDFGSMSEADFQQFYADLYVVNDFDSLVDQIVNGVYDYGTLGEPWETGTYCIAGNKIMCTVTGETKAESLGYEIDGDTLTLIYVDGVEVYSRSR